MIDAHILRGRAGQPVVMPAAASAGNTSPRAGTRLNGRVVDLDKLYERLVQSPAIEAIAGRDMNRLAQPQPDTKE